MRLKKCKVEPANSEFFPSPPSTQALQNTELIPAQLSVYLTQDNACKERGGLNIAIFSWKYSSVVEHLSSI